jgi:hypothetical protein
VRLGTTLRYIIGGFALNMMSKPIELQGDLAPVGSGERLGCHLLALVFVVCALVCFVRGVLAAFKRNDDHLPREPSKYGAIFADTPDTEDGIGSDSTLTRSMRNKRAEAAPSPPSASLRPQGGGFGRKQV